MNNSTIFTKPHPIRHNTHPLFSYQQNPTSYSPFLKAQTYTFNSKKPISSFKISPGTTSFSFRPINIHPTSCFEDAVQRATNSQLPLKDIPRKLNQITHTDIDNIITPHCIAVIAGAIKNQSQLNFTQATIPLRWTLVASLDKKFPDTDVTLKANQMLSYLAYDAEHISAAQSYFHSIALMANSPKAVTLLEDPKFFQEFSWIWHQCSNFRDETFGPILFSNLSQNSLRFFHTFFSTYTQYPSPIQNIAKDYVELINYLNNHENPFNPRFEKYLEPCNQLASKEINLKYPQHFLKLRDTIGEVNGCKSIRTTQSHEGPQSTYVEFKHLKAPSFASIQDYKQMYEGGKGFTARYLTQHEHTDSKRNNPPGFNRRADFENNTFEFKEPI